jgi:hypothetical protein
MLIGCVCRPSMLAAETIVVHFFRAMKRISLYSRGGGKFKYAYGWVGVPDSVKLRKAATARKFMRPYVEWT